MFFFIISLLLAGGNLAPLDYYPLNLGDQWEYQVTSVNKKENFVMKVMVEPSQVYEGKMYAVLTQQDKRGKMRSFICSDEKGVYLKQTLLSKKFTPEVSAVHLPAIPVIIFPLEKGEKFHWEGKLKVAWINKAIVMDGEILGEEEITVPAGSFKCVKIYFKIFKDKKTSDQYGWYAPRVGQVKYIGEEYIKLLKSYKTINKTVKE
ncbi:MAG: hypothetical protein ABII74_08590 [Elusimicrobiota bacterium]